MNLFGDKNYLVTVYANSKDVVAKLIQTDSQFTFERLRGISKPIAYDVEAMQLALDISEKIENVENKFNPFEFPHLESKHHFSVLDDYDEDKRETDFARDRAILMECGIHNEEKELLMISVIKKITPEPEIIPDFTEKDVYQSYQLN